MLKPIRLFTTALLTLTLAQTWGGRQAMMRAAPKASPPKLEWYIGLDKQRNDRIVVQLKTYGFPRESCFSDFTIQASFLDKQGAVQHRKALKIAKGMRENEFSEDSLANPYASMHEVRGNKIDYTLINCRVRMTRLQRSEKNLLEKFVGLFKDEKEPPKISEAEIGDERNILLNGPFQVRSTEVYGPLTAPEGQKKADDKPNQ